MSGIPQAASVLLAQRPQARELFVVTRAAALRFFGGFRAFPGGKVHTDDLKWAQSVPGLTGQHVAAVRELFEETGVLLAHEADGSCPPGGEELTHLRRELLAERLTFPDLLHNRNLHLRPEDLTFAGSLVTPPFSRFRFDTAFFVAVLPPRHTPEIWPGELTAGAWCSAEQVLADWLAGDSLVSPPSVTLLETIRGRAVEELPQCARPLFQELAAGRMHPIWFSPAVQMAPLLTQGLPPSTHTNAYLIGVDPAYLLDPGASDPAEQARLFDLLETEARAGRRLAGVVVTHPHPDHIGAVNAVAERYGVPVFAHPLTAQALRGRIEVTRPLEDEAILDLGPAPDGKGIWQLRAIHTPGHAPGHLAFYEPRYRLLFSGDMVSTLSSVLIPPPPDGDLTAYLDSLHRLRTLPARLLLPAHGSPSARPDFVLEECLRHRREREEQLLRALGEGPRTVKALAEEVYRGLPPELMRFAEMQVRAGLHKLQRDGLAAALDGDAWRGECAEPRP